MHIQEKVILAVVFLKISHQPESRSIFFIPGYSILCNMGFVCTHPTLTSDVFPPDFRFLHLQILLDFVDKMSLFRECFVVSKFHFYIKSCWNNKFLPKVIASYPSRICWEFISDRSIFIFFLTYEFSFYDTLQIISKCYFFNHIICFLDLFQFKGICMNVADFTYY